MAFIGMLGNDESAEDLAGKRARKIISDAKGRSRTGAVSKTAFMAAEKELDNAQLTAEQQAKYGLEKDQAALERDKFGLDRDRFGLDRDRFGLDQTKMALDATQDSEGPLYEGYRQGLLGSLGAPITDPNDRAKYETVVSYKYADGGEVAAGYPAYAKAMVGNANALSPEQYAKVVGALLSKRARNNMVARNAGQTQLYAKGGVVTDELQDVGGAMVDGPGTPKSDSVLAMIDGQQPARLSKDEFVIPKHVVDYYGTKHFDTLIAKAREAMGKARRKSEDQNYRQGGTVKRAMKC
jgi:hypothetical protein